MNQLVGTLAVAALIVSGAAAQSKERPTAPSSTLVSAIDHCRHITDPTQRLACYDSAANALVTATSSGEVSVVDRNDVRKVRHSLFGFSLPKVPFFSGDTTANEAQNKLDSTIVSVRQLANGYFRIGIADNNAVWETTDSSISLSPPEPGQKIEIVRGALGNYFIRINGQIGVRGKRVG
ncbi:MAG TPA: hypothetical protein VE968_09475 [Sphingomicrobium sp.]|nr:hypothetical protein [Sphingomicrobium sp.]